MRSWRDNLEKIGKRERVDAAVLRRAEELRQLQCHLVLFFDPADQYGAKQVANDPRDSHLLLHLIVLNYDGEPWWDVHPFVLRDERFEAAWKATEIPAA